MLRTLFKLTLRFIVVISVLVMVFVIYLMASIGMEEPQAEDLSILDLEIEHGNRNFSKIGNNWFRKNPNGLHEMYVEGSGFERGIAIGRLATDLAQYQEKVFVDQVERILPNFIYRSFLKIVVGYFNRNLDDYITEEYKMEIFGISKSLSDSLDNIAPKYDRLVNYHSAHDIGHAMQNMSLVGCTSFACWDESSQNSNLIIGRNFDFYVGDDFARNKLVLFVNPDSGYRFVSVAWVGMIGVLSGMNENGLTVTINAAKSDITFKAATPVSILAREILQYASNLEEAISIARSREIFVSESFLIGSANENKAIIIEKTKDKTEVYQTTKSYVICTNHFQSSDLRDSELNKEHLRTSASLYRFERTEELLMYKGRLDKESAAKILRDPNGINDENIGLGNEKAINQLIAHHSVIFSPKSLRMWVSTYPWQLGEYLCYDLNEIFESDISEKSRLNIDSLTIHGDTNFTENDISAFMKFSKYRSPFITSDSLNPDSIIAWNSSNYLSYLLAGDYYFEKGELIQAQECYKKGIILTCATLQEMDYMKSQIEKCN